MLAVANDNLDLTTYLIRKSPSGTVPSWQPCRSDTQADEGDWELITAGQRVQVMKEDPERGECCSSAPSHRGRDGSIAALGVRRRGRPPPCRS